MKKIFYRSVCLALAVLMLLGTLLLSACSDPSVGPGGDETTAGDETTGGNEAEKPNTPAWMNDIKEKLAALKNYYGRNMSVAIGGDSSEYASGSAQAI